MTIKMQAKICLKVDLQENQFTMTVIKFRSDGFPFEDNDLKTIEQISVNVFAILKTRSIRYLIYYLI